MRKLQSGVKKKVARKGAYPWAAMKIGQSVRYLGNTRTGPYVCAARANQAHKPKKFEGGYDDKGRGHIWRIK